MDGMYMQYTTTQILGSVIFFFFLKKAKNIKLTKACLIYNCFLFYYIL